MMVIRDRCGVMFSTIETDTSVMHSTTETDMFNPYQHSK